MPVLRLRTSLANALVDTVDSLGRLDYSEWRDFEYGDPRVTVWGRVHKDSRAHFHTQYATVTHMVAADSRRPGPPRQSGSTHWANPPGHRSAGGGPGPGTSSGGGIGSGAPAPLQYNPPPGNRQGGAGAAAHAGNSGGGTRSEVPAASQPRPQAAAPAAGLREIVPIAELQRALDHLQNYAHDNGLRWNVTITAAGLQDLANNRQRRVATLQQIRDNLNRQAEERNRQRDSSSDDDD